MDDHLTSLTADSDDEYDWEEVEVPEPQPQTIEITLNARPKTDPETRKKGISHAERLMLINCHKLHTVCLLANAWVRNKWLNDELLHARLLSICPLKLQNSFATIHKSRIPDQNLRGRMFENAIRDLTDWWSGSFEIVLEGHVRNRTFRDVEKILERYQLLSKDDDDTLSTEMDLQVLQDALDEEGEFVRSPKSLMKHLLMGRGTRDTSAQLFTALCRALGIPARLVASLQSAPWQAKIGKPRPKYERKKPKNKGKGKDPAPDNASQFSEYDQSDDEDDMEEVDIPSTSSATRDIKGKGKATSFPGSGQRLDGGSTSNKGKGREKVKPPIKLRKARPKGRTLASPSPTPDACLAYSDPTTTPPVFWTEVFSKPDGRWLPVDPIRCIVNKRKVFDPTPVSTNPTPNAAVAQFSRFNSPVPNKKPTRTPLKAENRLVYVLAFEEDGYARDVTRRYAREFSTKVAKMQGGSGAPNMGGGGKGRITWWNHVLSLVHRPYRLHRDDVEDEELEIAQMLEGMPTTIGGFKDHPVYVLTRHLKQTETIHPPPPSTPELGKFRGEPVYPRSAVVSLKTAENWMRNEGRTVKAGEQPLKMVKVRAGTVNKLRELEVLKEAGTSGEDGPPSDAMQGLYARSQTELYVPDPVVDGIVPKNNFGNIDLYTPSMLPQGGTHLPYKGIAKIARKLGFDFAEAVTGFEFRKRRAFPVIEGIIVAVENQETLLEAFWESERLAEEKARVKREERVIKQWTRLIQGLRIRQRLQEQYGTKSNRVPEDKATHKAKATTSKKEGEGANVGEVDLQEEAEMNGRPQIETEEKTSGHGGRGFVVGADDVVQAFHLPGFQYVPDASVVSFQNRASLMGVSSEKPTSALAKLELEEDSTSDAPDFITYDLDDEDNMPTATLDDADIGDSPNHPSAMAPKTMAQFAEDAAARQDEIGSSSTSARSSPPGKLPEQPQSEQTGDELTDNLVSSGTTENANAKVAPTKSDLDAVCIDPSDPSSHNVTEAPNEAFQSEQTPNANVKGTRGKTKSSIKPKPRPSRTTIISKTTPRRHNTHISGPKRARKDISDDEDPDMASVGRSDDDEYSRGPRASREFVTPAKRRRTARASAAPATSDPLTSTLSAAATRRRSTHSVPVPTRTLRPRTSKGATKLDV